MTESLGRVAAEAAADLDRKLAVIGVGGLSGSIYRHVIDISDDKIANPAEDEWNRKILSMMEQGDTETLAKACPDYAGAARVDMGFKHFAFILGAIGGNFNGARFTPTAPCMAAAPPSSNSIVRVEASLVQFSPLKSANKRSIASAALR